MLQTRHEHGGRSLGHAMGARKRAGKSEKLLSAGIIHGPFLGAGGLPRPPAVMCRAESSARASRSGVSDGRLQVIIIAAAEAIMQCGWVVGGGDDEVERKKVCVFGSGGGGGGGSWLCEKGVADKWSRGEKVSCSVQW